MHLLIGCKSYKYALGLMFLSVHETSLPVKSMPLSFVAYALAFFVASWLVSHALLMPKPIPGIPYNFFAQYLPWGDMVSLGIHYFRTGEVFRWLSLQNLHHKSPLVQLFLPSFSTICPTLVLADLPEIDDIVKRRTGELDRADLMHTWFGILAPRGMLGLKTSQSIFREQRRLWGVVLSPSFLDEVAAPCAVRAATELADLWERKAELAGPTHAFEAQDNIKMATLEAMWEMCTGSKFGLLRASIERLEKSCPIKSKKTDEVVFTQAKMPKSYEVLQTLLMCLDWVMLGFSSRLYTWFFTYTGVLGRAVKEKDIVLNHCIDTARQRVMTSKGQRTCALEEIIGRELALSSASEEKSNVENGAALRDELLELLITGHETTASSIAWALKYLTDNPDIQKRLKDSLILAFSTQGCFPLVTAHDIRTTPLPYLEAVIAETLRLSNTGPVSFRQTMASCEILGHHVPAGTPVVLVTAGPSYMSPDMLSTSPDARSATSRAAMSRQVELSSPTRRKADPIIYGLDVFEPERWLLSGSFDPNATHMLPFSAGPRGCFGKKIALLELRFILTILILRFEFPRGSERLSGYEAQDGLTSRPQNCYVSPRAPK
jgi:hypothetical protein